MGKKPDSVQKQLHGLGFSQPFASQIVTGARTPSLENALQIYRKLGLRFGLLVHATPSEIKVLERVAERAKASA